MDFTKTHVVHTAKVGSPLISCRYQPGSNWVFAGAQDYQVWRVNPQDGAKTAYPVESWVRGLAFADGGKTLITGGYDGRLMWWPTDGDAPQPIRSLDAHAGWIRAVAVSPDNTLLASVGNDRIVRLWNVADGTLKQELRGHESQVYNVAFHPQQPHLATGDLMGHIFDWDLKRGERVRSWEAKSLHKYDKTFRADIGGFRALRFDAAGKKLAASGITNVTNAFAGVGNPSVVVFDWETGKQQEYVAKSKPRGSAWGAAFHPDGTLIAASGGGGGGFLLFWKPGQKETAHEFKLPNTARDFDLHPDGLHTATAHHDGNIRICRLDAPVKS